MASPGKVDGLEQVMRNLNREVAGIKQRTMKGLMEAGLGIERSAKRRVPVNTGNLKASGYTRQAPRSTENNPQVEVGFTAAYAVFVHENMEMKLKGQPRPRRGYNRAQGNYWDPQGQAGPKFLQNAVSENADKIVAIVAHHARVRG